MWVCSDKVMFCLKDSVEFFHNLFVKWEPWSLTRVSGITNLLYQSTRPSPTTLYFGSVAGTSWTKPEKSSLRISTYWKLCFVFEYKDWIEVKSKCRALFGLFPWTAKSSGLGTTLWSFTWQCRQVKQKSEIILRICAHQKCSWRFMSWPRWPVEQICLTIQIVILRFNLASSFSRS